MIDICVFNIQSRHFPKTLTKFLSIGTNNGMKLRLDMKFDLHCQPQFGTIVSWALKQIWKMFIFFLKKNKQLIIIIIINFF